MGTSERLSILKSRSQSSLLLHVKISYTLVEAFSASFQSPS